MNAKLLIAAVAVVSLAGVSAASAAHHGKRHHHHHHMRHRAPVADYVQPGPPMAYTSPRPSWAAPGQCFTDEGYGRYRPCDASPSTR